MKGPAGYSRLLPDLFPLVSVGRLGTVVEWKLKNAVENDLFSSAPNVDQIFSITLKLAMDKGIRSIAFPSISTGVYSYPVDQAAEIAVHTVMDFVAAHPEAMDEIVWVLFDRWTKDAYDRALEKAEAGR